MGITVLSYPVTVEALSKGDMDRLIGRFEYALGGGRVSTSFILDVDDSGVVTLGWESENMAKKGQAILRKLPYKFESEKLAFDKETDN